jgi:UDP-N-acetylglucosamine transferase subunit ALG13
VIFVTVGMHTQSFHRLIDAMDAYAAATAEQVVMQIGHARATPSSARWFRFATYPEMQRLSREARIVVTHGATSILTSLQQGTPVVAVPRERRFDEHIDDHQIEFVEALARMRCITAVRDVRQLPEALSSEFAPPARPRMPSLAATLGTYVRSLR